MDLETLRERCEARLRELPLPRPFDVLSFCKTVERWHGREIRLYPVRTKCAPYGLWSSVPDYDVIFYEQGTSPLHRDHILLHELCHILCDHRPIPLSDPAVAQLLCPHLDSILIQQVLARISYGTEEECEAELLASLILDRVAAGSSSQGQGGERDVVLKRLEKSFGGETSTEG